MALRTSIILDLAGNLDRRAAQMQQSIGRFAQRGQQQLAGLNRSLQILDRGVDKISSRYTALITGAAGVGALRQVANLEARLTRLQTSGDASAEAIAKLKKEIFETANAPDIRVDPGEIIGAVEQIVEMVGDLDFASENIRNIGIALQATGSSGADMGAFLAELQKKGIRDSKDIMRVIDVLVQQGKTGAFAFKDLATQGSKLFTVYKKRGPEAIIEMGALAQVVRQAVGSSEQATTAIETLFASIVDGAKDIERLGVQVRVRDENGKPLEDGSIRSITDILSELTEKTKGNDFILSKIFDVRALRVFNALAIEGNVQLLKELRTLESTGAVISRDAQINAQTAAAAGRSIMTAVSASLDRTLAGPMQSFADAINSIEPERLDAIVERTAKIGLALGGAVVALKLLRGTRGLFGRGGAGGGVAGALGAAAGAPIPVYIVNNPLAGAAGEGIGTLTGYGGGKGIPARGGRLARWLGRAGRAAGPLALVAGGAMLANTLMDSERSTTAKIVDSSSILGGAAGGIGGAKLGAMIGTAIAPGIGTAIGAALGGIGGYLAGEFAGRKGASYLTGADKMNGELHIQIDSEGRPKVKSLRADGLDMTVNTGRTMGTFG